MPDLTIDEARAIIGNTDPRSDRYYNHYDQGLVDAVNGAFQRQYPGTLPDADTPRQFEAPPPAEGEQNSEAASARDEVVRTLGMIPGTKEAQEFHSSVDEFIGIVGVEEFSAVADRLEHKLGRARALKIFADVLKNFKAEQSD
jgi:hypothetical protein